MTLAGPVSTPLPSETPGPPARPTAGLLVTPTPTPVKTPESTLTKEEKVKKLQEFYEKKRISAEHFNCAIEMLNSGKTNRYLEELLSGKLPPEVFTQTFTCPAP